jgi:hypothetical protein
MKNPVVPTVFNKNKLVADSQKSISLPIIISCFSSIVSMLNVTETSLYEEFEFEFNLKLKFKVCGAKPFNAMFIDSRRRKDDRPWDETLEVITKNTPTYGFLCINNNNILYGKLCSDYKVPNLNLKTSSFNQMYVGIKSLFYLNG